MDEQGNWVNDADIRTSIDSSIKKAGHFWQVDVPVANKPADGRIYIFASNRNEFLHGETEIVLDHDANPSTTLLMKRDRSADAIGEVVDKEGVGIEGVLVYVQGHESETALTGQKGDFKVPAHAGPGELIRIQAAKEGYGPESVVAYAGTFKSITLLRK